MVRAAYLIPPLLIITSLAACTMQVPASSTQISTPLTIQTQAAARTVHPSETASTPAQPVDSTETPATSTPAAHITQTPVPARTSTPAQPCNLAAPGNPIDITIPDDTEIRAGEGFTKTWRLRNVGTCPWTQEYALVWFSGEDFDAVHHQALPIAVQPGQTVDISVDMIAPESSGTYQSNWKLSGADSNLFGIGPNGDAPFWVRIAVRQIETPSAEALPTITPTPVVYLNVVANLPVDSSLDLDTNQTLPAEESDLIYTMDGSGAHILTPSSGTKVGAFGTIQPTLEQCQTESLSGDPITLDNVAVGSYFCFKTNLGLPGWARLVLISPSDNLLALEILTWSIP